MANHGELVALMRSSGQVLLRLLLAALALIGEIGAKALPKDSSSPSLSKRDGGTVLHFPRSRSLGILRLVGGHSPVPAIGDVAIPPTAKITLQINYESSGDLSALEALPCDSVFGLSLRRLPIADLQLKHIGHLTGLQELNLCDTDIGDQGLQWLRNLKELKSLNLSGTDVTAKGLANLRGLTALENLELSDNHLGNSGIESLVSLKHLDRLQISRTNVGDKGLKSVAALPHLRSLNIQFTQISDAGISALTQMKGLEELQMAHTKVTPACIKYLSQLVSLRRLVYSTEQFSPNDLQKFHTAVPHCELAEFIKHKKIDLELFEPMRY